MVKNNVKIFFDESGKRSDKPTTMGAMLIPSVVYENEIIKSINDRLKNKEFKLHWKNYGGHADNKKIIKEVIYAIMKFHSMYSFNIINYKKPNKKGLDDELFKDMVYTKLPERILYGLLRNQGSDISIDAEVFIEKATEYTSKELKEDIPRRLNKQAMYRGENYNIIDCQYKEKNMEIGVELVDLILGIIRTIILNKNIYNGSKKCKAKNELIVELLKNKNFYSFLSNINYFEWSNTHELRNIDFKSYIQLFLANQPEWLKFLAEN